MGNGPFWPPLLIVQDINAYTWTGSTFKRISGFLRFSQNLFVPEYSISPPLQRLWSILYVWMYLVSFIFLLSRLSVSLDISPLQRLLHYFLVFISRFSVRPPKVLGFSPNINIYYFNTSGLLSIAALPSIRHGSEYFSISGWASGSFKAFYNQCHFYGRLKSLLRLPASKSRRRLLIPHVLQMRC